MTSGDRTWQSWPLGTLFTSVAPGRATLRAMATDAENLDLVRRFWDTLYAKDFDGLKAFFDERSQYWDVPTRAEAAAVGPDDIDGRLRLGLEPLAGCPTTRSRRWWRPTTSWSPSTPRRGSGTRARP